MATDRDLLAAYLDGVSELSPDERRRVEALLEAEPALRTEATETSALLGKLRAMPEQGTEPEWSMLERRIANAVGQEVPRLPWWRRAWFVAPIGAVAVTAAVALVLFRTPHEAARTSAPDANPTTADVPRAEAPAAEAVWLDGHVVELGDIDDPTVLLDDDDGDEVAGGLLPASDLRWIDSLDDKSVDRAEHWLAGKKG